MCKIVTEALTPHDQASSIKCIKILINGPSVAWRRGLLTLALPLCQICANHEDYPRFLKLKGPSELICFLTLILSKVYLCAI